MTWGGCGHSRWPVWLAQRGCGVSPGQRVRVSVTSPPRPPAPPAGTAGRASALQVQGGPEPHTLPAPHGPKGRGRGPGQSAVQEAGGEGRVTCHRQATEARDRQPGDKNKSHGGSRTHSAGPSTGNPRGHHGKWCVQWALFPHNGILEMCSWKTCARTCTHTRTYTHSTHTLLFFSVLIIRFWHIHVTFSTHTHTALPARGKKPGSMGDF